MCLYLLLILCVYHYREVGRPRLDISIDEVSQLRSLGFSCTRIAEILNISRRTLYRRLEGSDIVGYTDITAQELDSIILAYKLNHPNDGEVMIIGHLRASHIHVPRSEVRSAIHRVDSAGVSARRSTTIRRRVYEVEAPNSVWHIDGAHMTQHRANTRSVVVGSSVHKVRIERLWRDVRRGVVDVYREIFGRLESDQVLDSDNDVDIFCLHEVFVPRINKSLTEFVLSWHNHPISSENNMTPLQLFYTGLLEVEEEDSSDDAQHPLPTTLDHVEIPHIPYTPCTALKLHYLAQRQKQMCHHKNHPQYYLLHLNTTHLHRATVLGQHSTKKKTD